MAFVCLNLNGIFPYSIRFPLYQLGLGPAQNGTNMSYMTASQGLRFAQFTGQAFLMGLILIGLGPIAFTQKRVMFTFYHLNFSHNY